MIHFIWLGSPVSPQGKQNIESWRLSYPEEDVKVWSAVPEEAYELCGDLLASCPNHPSTSDILRCWLLWKYGGLYVDVDTRPLRNMSLLFTTYDNFCAMPKVGAGYISNYVLYAAKPGQPVWLDILETCRRQMLDGGGEEEMPYHFGLIHHHRPPVPGVYIESYVHHESNWRPKIRRTMYPNPPKQNIITSEEQQQRLDICRSCEYLMSNDICRKCRCSGRHKSRLASVHCPIQKW